MSNLKMKTMVALAAALAVSGCTGKFYDERSKGYVPDLPHQIYPIDVADGKVRLEIPVAGSRLTSEEIDAVRRLAYKSASLSTPVYVRRPASSVTADVKAAHVTRLLVRMGVAPERIHHVTGSANSLEISYARKFAVTKSCDDMWSRPVTETADNRPMPGFGCSTQHNIAAMVDNPEDFQKPRAMTPADINSRIKAVNKFRKREDFNSAKSSQSKISVKDAKAN